jgi:hypothetical protein
MSGMQRTLNLYKETARQTGGAFLKSAPAMVFLVAASLVLGALAIFLSPFGFAGGLVLGLATAAGAGSYLRLIERSVMDNAPVEFADWNEVLGTYLWEVISVMFIFWIAQMVITLLGLGFIGFIALVVALVLFNPVPELIYQKGARGLDALSTAFECMRKHWLEWFVPHVVLGVGLAFVWPGESLNLLLAFGPFFGFLSTADPLATGLMNRSLSAAIVTQTGFALVIVHGFMLFRGFLFRKLGSGSSRLRAWQSQF